MEDPGDYFNYKVKATAKARAKKKRFSRAFKAVGKMLDPRSVAEGFVRFQIPSLQMVGAVAVSGRFADGPHTVRGAYDAVFDTVISPTQQEGINEGFMVASEVAAEIAEKIGPEASLALSAFNPALALPLNTYFTGKELARHEDMRPYVGTLMAAPALFVGGGIGYTALAEGIQAHFEGRGYDLKGVGIQTLTSFIPGQLTSGIKAPWLRAGTNQAIGSALGAGLNGGDFNDMLDAAWKGAVAGVVANRWGSGNAVLSSGLSTAAAGVLNGDSGNDILRSSLMSMAVSYTSSLASALEAQRKSRRQSQPTYLTDEEMWERSAGMLADNNDVHRVQAQQNMLYPDPLLYTVCDITTGNITSGGEKDALTWQYTEGTTGGFIGSAGVLEQGGVIRDGYNAWVAYYVKESGGFSPTRNAIRDYWNQSGSSTALSRGVAKMYRWEQGLSDTQSGMGSPRATAEAVNRAGAMAKWGGRGLIVAGVGLSVYDIATAPDPYRATVQNGSATVVGAGGATAFAWAGAAIGSFIPGPGTAVGAVVGGIIGGVLGGVGGHALGTAAYDANYGPNSPW